MSPPPRRLLPALSWLLVAATIVVLLAGVGSHAHAYSSWFEATIDGFAFTVVGTILLAKRPDNRVSWLFGVNGLIAITCGFTGQWGALAAADHLPGRAVAMVGTEAISGAFLSLLALLLLYFPDGEPPAPAWRLLTPALLLTAVAGALSNVLTPGPFDEFRGFVNPLGWHSAAEHTLHLLSNASQVGGLLGIVSIVDRYRRGRSLQREQLRPFLLAAAAWLPIVVMLVFIPVPSWLNHAVFGLGVAGLAAGATVSVLLYRLYDIDRVVSRTVSYAVLTGLLVVTYVLLVAGIQSALPAQSSLAVAASTLTVAALFQPLRRRIQQAVDRRFNRARYDAERVVERFAGSTRHHVALPQVESDLLDVVRRTVQPAQLSLWLTPTPEQS